MDLFSTETIKNILPYDGITEYHGIILDKKKLLFTMIDYWKQFNGKMTKQYYLVKRS